MSCEEPKPCTYPNCPYCIPGAFHSFPAPKQRCPVCEGRGVVPYGFYTYPEGKPFIGTNSGTEPCRGCNGVGII